MRKYIGLQTNKTKTTSRYTKAFYAGLIVSTISPVSYTHLDVYKRQGIVNQVDCIFKQHVLRIVNRVMGTKNKACH